MLSFQTGRQHLPVLHRGPPNIKVMNFISNYSSRVPTNQEGRRILRKETNLLLDLLGSPERYRRVGANKLEPTELESMKPELKGVFHVLEAVEKLLVDQRTLV